MEGKDVRLRIRGIQYPPRTGDGGRREDAAQPVETVQEVAASYFYRAGAHYLLYEEQPEGFDRPLKTRIKRRGRHLEIERQGSMGGRMIFEPGKIWKTEYGMPFGRLPLEILTETFEIMQDEGSADETEADMQDEGSADGTEADMPDDDAGDWKNVRIRYTLMNQGAPLGEYELEIKK